MPKKRTKKHPLTAEEKRFNREISSERVPNEHAIGFIKRFKILSERYRNRRKRFGLRFNLISGICNFEFLDWFRKRSNEIPSSADGLTFRQLKISYEEKGKVLNEQFMRTLFLLTKAGEPNSVAYLMSDENGKVWIFY